MISAIPPPFRTPLAHKTKIAATYHAGDLGCVGITCKPAKMRLFLDAVMVDEFIFTQPGAVSFWPANDLTMGVHMPIPEGV